MLFEGKNIYRLIDDNEIDSTMKNDYHNPIYHMCKSGDLTVGTGAHFIVSFGFLDMQVIKKNIR